MATAKMGNFGDTKEETQKGPVACNSQADLIGDRGSERQSQWWLTGSLTLEPLWNTCKVFSYIPAINIANILK